MRIPRIRLPRIRIEWYKPGGLINVDDYKTEIEFNENEMIIIKASVLKEALAHMSRKIEELKGCTLTVEEKYFEFKTDHFLAVDKSWEGYKAIEKLWNEAAEAMEWSDE